MKSPLAKKSLGQNFLVDPNIKQKMIAACAFSSSDNVFEIGPGRGAITELIAPHVKKLIAVEKDKLLARELKKNLTLENLTIHTDDILKFSFKDSPKQMKLVGNLPYYISSAIIKRILMNRVNFKQCFITIQDELANRLIAKPHSKKYGAFSLFVQFHAKVQKLFRIKNTAFRPIPKVHSAFVCLDLYKKSPYPSVDRKVLFTLTQLAFQQRRKTLLNALSTVINKVDLEKTLTNLQLNPKIRAENLSIHDYIAISQMHSKTVKGSRRR